MKEILDRVFALRIISHPTAICSDSLLYAHINSLLESSGHSAISRLDLINYLSAKGYIWMMDGNSRINWHGIGLLSDREYDKETTANVDRYPTIDQYSKSKISHISGENQETMLNTFRDYISTNIDTAHHYSAILNEDFYEGMKAYHQRTGQACPTWQQYLTLLRLCNMNIEHFGYEVAIRGIKWKYFAEDIPESAEDRFVSGDTLL